MRLSDNFYGIGRRGLPYQSVYKNGEEIIVGRRRDIYDRLNLVDSTDLQDQEVLDLGSNIGSSAFLAAERGASVLGVEYDPDLVTGAIRLNSIFAYSCEFLQSDLSTTLDLDSTFHTGFCFAIDKHVNNNKTLSETIDEYVENILYFETHPESDIPAEIESIAESISFIDNIGPNSKRGFYKLQL